MKAFLFFVLLIGTQWAMAQNMLVDNYFTQEYSINSSTTTGPSLELLNKLAAGSGASVFNTRINLSTNIRLSLERKDKRLHLLAEMKDIHLSGSTEYRQFDMATLLMPSHIDFSIDLKHKDQWVETIKKDGVRINGENSLIADTNMDDSTSRRNYSLTLRNVVFRHDAQSRDRAVRQMQLIDEYYNSADVVRQRSTLLRNIDINNIERLMEYRTILMQNNKIIQDAYSADFYKTLNLNTNDPMGLVAQLIDLNTATKNKQYAVDDMISRLHVIYYERGQEAKQAGNLVAAEDFMNKAIKQNNDYAPPYYELAEISYKRKDMQATYERLKRFEALSATSADRTQSKELATKMYKDLITEVHQLNAARKYEEALTKVQFVAELCKGLRNIDCDTQLNTEYTTTANGLYLAILDEIQVAVAAQEMTKAEQMVRKSRDFQRKYPTYITPDQDLQPKLELIMNTYMSMANKKLTAKRYEEAVTEFENARRFCEAEAKITCPEELPMALLQAHEGVYAKLIDNAETLYISGDFDAAENALSVADSYQTKQNLNKSPRIQPLFLDIKYAIYKKHIADGLAHTQRQNYEDALADFGNARRLEEKFGIPKDSNLPRHTEQAARNYITELVGDGERFVTYNQLNEAHLMFDKAAATAATYSLDSDAAVKKMLDTLSEKIFSQHCTNKRAEFEQQHSQALRFEREKRYIEAVAELEKAIATSNSARECAIATNEVSLQLSAMTIPASFQKQIIESRQYVDQKQYSMAISTYEKAQKYYAQNELAEFGLVCEPLDKFMLNSNNTGFMLYGLSYLTKAKEVDKALVLLAEIERHGVNKKDTRTEQQALGIELANRDFNAGQVRKAKAEVLNYTKDNSWYKYLGKSYLKQWKRLD